jgi:hypothetical protein
MSETIRRETTDDQDFWPRDTETKIYRGAGMFSSPLDKLMELAKKKWPDAEPMDIQVNVAHGKYLVLEYKPVPEQEKIWCKKQEAGHGNLS